MTHPTTAANNHTSLPITCTSAEYRNLLEIFYVLSSEGNLQLFLQADGGLKFNFHVLEKSGFSKRQYHRGVASLKRLGLIEKTKNTRRYFHTTFGKAIYKNITSMKEYSKQTKELKIIDILKQSGEFAETDIVSLIKKVLPNSQYNVDNIDNIVDASHYNHDNTTVSIIWSYEKMIELLIEQIQQPMHEILIATRTSPDIIINHLLSRVKSGVQLKVLVDTNLIRQYISLQKNRLDATDKNNAERLNVIANPWYPYDSGDSVGKGKIERRVTDIPFGMIIQDNDKIGIEIIDAYNVPAFTCGISIQSRNICNEMKSYYQRLWNQASSVTSIIDNIVSSQKIK
jgi:hypothetical protein